MVVIVLVVVVVVVCFGCGSVGGGSQKEMAVGSWVIMEVFCHLEVGV